MTRIHDKLFGNIPYVAPEILKAGKSEQDPYTKYSDVYSLGVLLWNISSGKAPFKDQKVYTISTSILSGIREERIQNTPDEYFVLYSKCWNDVPEERHHVEDVYEVLERLLENYNEEKGSTFSGKIEDPFEWFENSIKDGTITHYCSKDFNDISESGFGGDINECALISKIYNGEREHPVPNTNAKFVELYQKCWQLEPDKRPDIQQINDLLKTFEDVNINEEYIVEINSISVTQEMNEMSHEGCDLEDY
ncbi:17632_t:CDS:2 [Funneliformis caledonium]|uniref:17632_t:CDS:1 n=1 Tax=Funneliformis caledonium TaxID=1117310 RepID=A0A9N8Z6B2_9GLOM|nr:17632_t:CDS:2 [Funneliformis caledonium]